MATPLRLPGHGQNRGLTLFATYTATMAVAAVLVAVRLYVRARMLKKLWWDDLFVTIGLVRHITIIELTSKQSNLTKLHQLITIIALAFLTIAVDVGIGRHIFDLQPLQISRAFQYELFTRVSMGLSMMFTRMSIGLLMLRFSATKRWFEISIYCVLGLIVASHIPLAVLATTRCDPVRKYWRPKLPGRCQSKHLALSIGYFNCGL